MTAKLIILRGNSASGKTTLANKLAAKLPESQTLVLHQDMLRRDLLHASDHEGTLAVPLIKTLAEFGRQHYQYTIIEGILRRDVYGPMLKDVAATFAPSVWQYYLDLPFEETARRDRAKAVPFGEATLRSWWRDQDQLAGDEVLGGHSTSDLAEQIYREVMTHE
ncbi:AAA family ATPase [Lacticaseibacillus hegangensis]|uniref:AAA family ATPase n=1 Tax=Lacticaseibacillus hegangensis TaxID=2486010 RepID=A0ABW4CVL9_9LACO|nr:AAA family ATPase [Lacticaseibacillus hegangensis]